MWSQAHILVSYQCVGVHVNMSCCFHRWGPWLWKPCLQHLWVCPHTLGEQEVQEHSEESFTGTHLLHHTLHADHGGSGLWEVWVSVVFLYIYSFYLHIQIHLTDQGVDGQPAAVCRGWRWWHVLLFGSDIGTGSVAGESIGSLWVFECSPLFFFPSLMLALIYQAVAAEFQNESAAALAAAATRHLQEAEQAKNTGSEHW